MSALHTILLIEDEKLIRDLLKETLESEPFIIIDAVSTQRASNILEQHTVDLTLLDLNLGKESALPFIPELKSKSGAPVIILSGEKSEAVKIQSLESGADDFIEKPFNQGFLKAKIRAFLRRTTENIQTQNAQRPTLKELRLGNWKVDPQKMQVFCENGKSAELTSREYTLLDYLIKNAGHTLSRQNLCEAIREQNYVPSPRAIDVKITRLRKKLDDDPAEPRIIKTVRGAGYILDETALAQ